MKITLLGLVLFLFACNRIENDDVKSFIPGVYIKSIVNEFSKGMDTLIITELNDGSYKISRTSSFRRIRNGKLKPLERKVETWIAIYDKEKKVLRETRKGKILSFRKQENMLLVGGSEYQKINN